MPKLNNRLKVITHCLKISLTFRVKILSEQLKHYRRPDIERQGGALSIVSSIASNPGTLYALSAVGGMSVSPNLAAVREVIEEAIMNIVGKIILL